MFDTVQILERIDILWTKTLYYVSILSFLSVVSSVVIIICFLSEGIELYAVQHRPYDYMVCAVQLDYSSLSSEMHK